MIPDTISHYRILGKLGAGGMGEVYLAEDTQLRRKVAIKFLPPESTADDQAKRRLIHEARAAAKLDHSNICLIYEVGDEGGHTFIVTQYLEGETLASRLQRNPMELKESLYISVQIADALSEAHSCGITHRDIKPQNIMLTAREQAGQGFHNEVGISRGNRGATDGGEPFRAQSCHAGCPGTRLCHL